MKFIAAALAFGAAVASVNAQSAQGSCSPDFPTAFTFQTQNVSSSSKRDLEGAQEDFQKRQSLACGSSVTLHLGNSTLNDAKGRTGYVASNDQFQFDAPPQAGYKQTNGFEVCTLSAQEQRLALDGNEIFYNCLSGTFYNIYTTSQGKQCTQVYIQVFGCQPSSPIPTAPINSVPFPSGTLSAGGSETAAPESATSTSESMSMMVMTAQTAAPSSMASSLASSVATPYPVGNSTTAAATGTGAPATTTSTKASSTPKPSAFTGAADIVAVGQKFVAMVAVVAAFALF